MIFGQARIKPNGKEQKYSYLGQIFGGWQTVRLANLFCADTFGVSFCLNSRGTRLLKIPRGTRPHQCLRWVLVQLVCYRCTTLNICLVILPAPCTFWRNALVIIAFGCVGNGRFCVHTCLHNMLVCTPRRSRVYGCARALCVYREVDFSVAPITFSTSLCCDTQQ